MYTVSQKRPTFGLL